jgi:pimeloyl-ACP methyl ester carboxylesterase
MTAPHRTVAVPIAKGTLQGDLSLPERATGVVLFAHGSGSGRHSPRNRFVARGLNDGDLATLLIDLLTEDEERIDAVTGHLRFDIDLLARRLDDAIAWLAAEPDTAGLALGLFGASTGAAAALRAAAAHPGAVRAVVSRGGRPDLAGGALDAVRAPTLLIVGGADGTVLELNERARRHLPDDARLEVVPEAGHLFEEPGALERVTELARAWFVAHLTPPATSERPAR